MIIHGVACGHSLIVKAPELEFGGTEEHSCYNFLQLHQTIFPIEL